MKNLWILSILLLCSCSYVGPNEKYSAQDILNIDSSVDDRSVVESLVSNSLTDNSSGIVGPLDRNWISPGKVYVSGMYPGGRATYFVQVHNGKKTDSIFNIVAREVDRLDSGYDKKTPLSWVFIANKVPLVSSGETVTIPVYVEMPLDYRNNYQEKTEFLISVIDTGCGGNVIVEFCSKWCITTK